MDNFTFSVSLGRIAEEFKLEPVCVFEKYEKIKIITNEVNRPGLQIAGFFDNFYNDRIQIMGREELSYLEKLSSDAKKQSLEHLFEKNIPCVIVSRNLPIPDEMNELSQKYKVPVLRTSNTTSRFMSALIAFLNVELAPRITMHGVLVEVYGEGILLLGDSGVGKSEAAIELVKRGHRLVADDAVEIKRVSDISLLGSAPDVIRHFVELRGIGIVDVKMIFGIGAVKNVEKIDFIINLELWQDKKQYDRLGLTTEYTDILGIDIPSITVPVKPGRNLAVVIEVAAMNNRQKKMGYNAAEALNNRVMSGMALSDEE
ncbi:MAG: HPr(Ser) kinase/phosphatase [Clostridia bacterium]|nr:HPr(Ser) kinase/phosphatase [Clostridia bacterium]